MTTPRPYTIQLRPLMGDRFQPTGFPDLGAALFKVKQKDGSVLDCLHVESPQSMANRMEATTWVAADHDQPRALTGLPYVRVVDEDGVFLTSSRLEAHRLASAYVIQGTVNGDKMIDSLKTSFGLEKGKPLDQRRVAREVFRLDPLSLVHGVFFARSEWPWQPKFQRVVTCFIDARDVLPAVSGGVKTDSLDTQGDTKSGAGMVPHSRTEYTAREIAAHVWVDHAQIRSFGLGTSGEELLSALVDYELSMLFRGDALRLRTACALTIDDDADLSDIPAQDEAAKRVGAAIKAAGGLLGPITEVVKGK